MGCQHQLGLSIVSRITREVAMANNIELRRDDSSVPHFTDSIKELEGSLTMPQELAVLARVRRFLGDMVDQIEGTELSVVADACVQMIALHHGQEREPGVPYYPHPLLVTIMAAERFGLPVDPARLVLTLYHDVPEDQASRVGDAFTVNPTHSAEEAIDAIAKRYSAAISTERIKEGLTLLTNPDFGALATALQSGGSGTDPETFKHASILYSYARQICRDIGQQIPEDPTLLDTTGIKRLLYLGHFREIREKSPVVFQVKLADFYANGLHFHLFKRKLDDLSPDDPVRQVLEKKVNKLALKYGPVVRHLMHEFDSAAADGISILGSRDVDSWYRGKLDYVWRHGYQR